MDPVNRTDELELAIAAVRRAAQVTRAVQQTLLSDQTLEKNDRSPVTVADYASQALVCQMLRERLPDDPIVGEEDATALRDPQQVSIRERVVEQVLKLADPASEDDVLNWIDAGNAAGGAKGRFWTLDPIDGTKGFLRKQQYAIALALIEDGQVVLGALGCPNLPGSNDDHGSLVFATRGGGAHILPLSQGMLNDAQPISVSGVSDPAAAQFCESVESGHSDQSQSAQIAQALGITAAPVRMDSQAKYAALARGDASIYLRLPTRADYVEKIWDHAAGMIVVEEAGGKVTDITGAPLAFDRGRTLEANRGIVATNTRIHEPVLAAVQQVLAPGSTST